MNKPKDLTNQKFGNLTAIELFSVGNKTDRRRKWKCICDCGREIILDSTSLIKGKRTHCGCKNIVPFTPLRQNLTGKRFGRLLVIEPIKIGKNYKWHCICDCGNETNVKACNLNSGSVSSCGCLWKENSLLRGKEAYKDGRSHERLYKIYEGMITRCYNKNRPKYHIYGERRITVCKEWLDDYTKFKEWSLNNGYNEELSIDRIDVNGNYEPSNCRWVTMFEQSQNRIDTIFLTINGETKPLTEWARETNQKAPTIRGRKYRGWSDYECVFGKEL